MDIPTMQTLVQARAGDANIGLRFGDVALTWDEVVTAASQRAAYLLDRKPEGSEPFHVGVLLDNTPEFFFMLCAGALSGATIVGIEEAAVLIEGRGRTLLAGFGIAHVGADAFDRLAERAARRARDARHVEAALGRAVAIGDVAPEPFGKALDVERCRLVAERELQRVLGVVELFGRREDVGQRLADVVEERHAVLAHIGQPTARRKLAPQDRGSAARDDVAEPGDLRVRVKQRHDAVAVVGGRETEHLRELRPVDGEPAVSHLHGLRCAGRARGEDQ